MAKGRRLMLKRTELHKCNASPELGKIVVFTYPDYTLLSAVVPECFNIVFTFKAKGTAEMMRLICVLPQNGGGTEEVE